MEVSLSAKVYAITNFWDATFQRKYTNILTFEEVTITVVICDLRIK